MKIGIDIGGTNIRIAGMDIMDSRQLVGETSLPNTADYEANVQRISEVIGDISTEISGIGISTPGTFNDDDSMMIHSTNMPQWVNQPSITLRLAEVFNCRVAKANDTECGALGEAYARTGTDPFFFISYGTGISGTLVTYEDGIPQAQKLTHYQRAKYFYGWQDDCSGAGIMKDSGKTGDQLTDDEWATVMQRFSEHLADLMQEFTPAEVVFGGGIAIKQADRLAVVMHDFKASHPEYSDHTFSFAALGEKAALFGAVALLN